MCLLTVKPAKVKINWDHMLNGYNGNPNGCGFAVAVNGALVIQKGRWNFEEFKERLSKYEDHPALIHFRLATHGAISDDLCHPFELPTGWALGHNGIIDTKMFGGPVHYIAGPNSDTSMFCKAVVGPALERNEHILEDAEYCKYLKDMVGRSNKIAFQHADGRQFILNQDCGVSLPDGTWHSNSGYKEEDSWRRYWAGRDEVDGWHIKGSKYVKSYTPTGSFDDPGPYSELNVTDIRCDYCGDALSEKFHVDWRNRSVLCHDCFMEEERLAAEEEMARECERYMSQK